MKQITKYVLPADTKRLYKDEAISSIALSKEVADKLNELIEYVNFLYKNSVEMELDQTGKINKAVIYMKDNLSNSIHELFEILKANGDIDSLITESVNDTLAKLEKVVLPLGNALAHGAYGDGVHNDTISILSAISSALALNEPLIIPEGKYLVSADLDLRYIKNVDIRGEIITDKVLTIGSSSADGSGIKVNIKKAPYIKVVGVKNSIINIDYTDKLHLFADGDELESASLAYTQFYGAYAKEIIIESTGSSENIGWINENVFRIKRVEKISMDGNYAHNNNHFEHINLEKGVVNFQNARNNHISARCEGGVTITEGSDVNHNFIEKEYYYKHYFGDDVTETEKGTLSYFPVNKLQSERLLMQVDRYNKHYPIGSLEFNENGYFNGNTFNAVFKSNLIKIDKTFAIKLKSNAKAFRVELKFYDVNKNHIISEVDNFADGKMKYNGDSTEWTYSVSANVDSDSVTFYPGEAKYVEYRVLFGNSVENINVEYLTIKLLKYINTDIHVTNTLKLDTYTSLPSTGYFEQGQIMYAARPEAGTSIGVICVESGSPGVWKNFGSIAS